MPSLAHTQEGTQSNSSALETNQSGVVEIRPVGFNCRRLGAPALAYMTSTESSKGSDMASTPRVQVSADRVDGGGAVTADVDLHRRTPSGCRVGRPGRPPTNLAARTVDYGECAASGAAVTATAAAAADATVSQRNSTAFTEPAPGTLLIAQNSLAARSEGSTCMGGTVVMPPYTDAMTTRSSDACLAHMHTELSGSTEDVDQSAASHEHVLGMHAVESVGPGALGGISRGGPQLHHGRGYDSIRWLASRSAHAPLGDIALSTTDMRVGTDDLQTLLHRLDAFGKHDLFLEQYVVLGREQRRRGGPPQLHPAANDCAMYCLMCPGGHNYPAPLHMLRVACR